MKRRDCFLSTVIISYQPPGQIGKPQKPVPHCQSPCRESNCAPPEYKADVRFSIPRDTPLGPESRSGTLLVQCGEQANYSNAVTRSFVPHNSSSCFFTHRLLRRQNFTERDRKKYKQNCLLPFSPSLFIPFVLGSVYIRATIVASHWNGVRFFSPSSELAV